MEEKSWEMENFLLKQEFTENDFKVFYPKRYEYYKEKYLKKGITGNLWSMRTQINLGKDLKALGEDYFQLLIAIKKKSYHIFDDYQITPSTLLKKDGYDQTLLENIIFLNDQTLNNYFYAAVKKYWIESTKILRDSNAYNCTLWHFAAALNQNGDEFEDIVKLFKIETINTQNQFKSTPIHFAVASHAHIALDALLSMEGININIRDNTKKTPLHMAVRTNDIISTQTLLEQNEKLDINAQDESDNTALHYAVVIQNEEMVDILLSIPNIKPEIQNSPYNNSVRSYKGTGTPLHLAAEKDLVDIMQKLIKRNPNLINIERQLDGYTPLHCAARRGKTFAIKLLLKFGADPLMRASEFDYLYLFDNGYTPLHLAIINENINAVLPFLVTDVAKRLCAETKLKFTPLDYAAEQEDERFIAILCSALLVNQEISNQHKYELCEKAFICVRYRKVAYTLAHWLIKFYVEMLNDDFDRVEYSTMFGFNKANKIRAAIELQRELEKEIPQIQNLLHESQYSKELKQGSLGGITKALVKNDFIEEDAVREYKSHLKMAALKNPPSLGELLGKIDELKLPDQLKFKLLLKSLNAAVLPEVKLQIGRVIIKVYIKMRTTESAEIFGIPKDIKLSAAKALEAELNKEQANLKLLLANENNQLAFNNGRLGEIILGLGYVVPEYSFPYTPTTYRM